jgi:hypothetical protein
VNEEVCDKWDIWEVEFRTNAYKILVGKLKRKRQFVRPRSS